MRGRIGIVYCFPQNHLLAFSSCTLSLLELAEKHDFFFQNYEFSEIFLEGQDGWKMRPFVLWQVSRRFWAQPANLQIRIYFPIFYSNYTLSTISTQRSPRRILIFRRIFPLWYVSSSLNSFLVSANFCAAICWKYEDFTNFPPSTPTPTLETGVSNYNCFNSKPPPSKTKNAFHN